MSKCHHNMELGGWDAEVIASQTIKVPLNKELTCLNFSWVQHHSTATTLRRQSSNEFLPTPEGETYLRLSKLIHYIFASHTFSGACVAAVGFSLAVSIIRFQHGVLHAHQVAECVSSRQELVRESKRQAGRHKVETSSDVAAINSVVMCSCLPSLTRLLLGAMCEAWDPSLK